MIQVGKTYPTVGGGKVKIATKTTSQNGDVVFTGANGVWYNRFGQTERGLSLCLIVAKPLGD